MFFAVKFPRLMENIKWVKYLCFRCSKTEVSLGESMKIQYYNWYNKFSHTTVYPVVQPRSSLINLKDEKRKRSVYSCAWCEHVLDTNELSIKVYPFFPSFHVCMQHWKPHYSRDRKCGSCIVIFMSPIKQVLSDLSQNMECERKYNFV